MTIEPAFEMDRVSASKVTQDDPEKRANSKYYYYDLENKKTRIIALDAIDYEAKYDENGKSS